MNITQDPTAGCQESPVLSCYVLKLQLAGDLRQVPGLGSLAVKLHLPMPTHSLKEENGSPVRPSHSQRGRSLEALRPRDLPPRSASPHLSGTMSPSTLNLRHLLPSRHGGRAPSTGQQSTRWVPDRGRREEHAQTARAAPPSLQLGRGVQGTASRGTGDAGASVNPGNTRD